jgi:hypothetical protein
MDFYSQQQQKSIFREKMTFFRNVIKMVGHKKISAVKQFFFVRIFFWDSMSPKNVEDVEKEV